MYFYECRTVTESETGRNRGAPGRPVRVVLLKKDVRGKIYLGYTSLSQVYSHQVDTRTSVAEIFLAHTRYVSGIDHRGICQGNFNGLAV